MWQQWRYFYVTVATLMGLMYWTVSNEWATTAIHSLMAWVADIIMQ